MNCNDAAPWCKTRRVSGEGSGRAYRVEVVTEINTLSDYDDASAFEVARPTKDGRSAEEWARDIFEGAPPLLRALVLFGWRYVSWFRLGPRPSPDHVLGWKIESTTHDTILLEVRSPLFTAQKVVRMDTTQVVTTTWVRYERFGARAVWSVLAPIHCRMEPRLLSHAASHPAQTG